MGTEDTEEFPVIQGPWVQREDAPLLERHLIKLDRRSFFKNPFKADDPVDPM